jgi:hypothetical protein
MNGLKKVQLDEMSRLPDGGLSDDKTAEHLSVSRTQGHIDGCDVNGEIQLQAA